LPVPATAGVPRPSGAPGNLTVLPWAGFKAAVSYTFDDANSSQIVSYGVLKALGVRMTFYLITSKPDASSAVWMEAVQDGHEIGNHSHTHAQVGTGPDLDAASTFIQQRLGVTAWTMASPFGDMSYPPLAMSRFLANRGVNNGLVAPNDNTNPFNLPCYVPPTDATAATFDAEVQAARTAGRWKIILVHGFMGGSDGAYLPVALDQFTASVEQAKAYGDVWIDSLVNVAAYWRGEKVLRAAPSAIANDKTTWTWTLPEHFPPGRRLRVKVDGGTVTQAGNALAWDDHGYYEIALDAGELTLGP
jgi:peptidoglycan/xylan/chitin deacetylase (PgdA/CDA1 family)